MGMVVLGRYIRDEVGPSVRWTDGLDTIVYVSQRDRFDIHLRKQTFSS